MTNLPLVYIPGNHDKPYLKEPPEGCIDCDGKLKVVKGLRIVGLGGSMKYNDQPFHYSQAQMNRRVQKLLVPILVHGGFDILLTHAPAFDLGDSEDIAHRGFKAFRILLDKFSPLLMVHGHVHMNYGYKTKRETKYKDTTIVNAYDRYIITIDDEKLQNRNKKKQ